MRLEDKKIEYSKMTQTSEDTKKKKKKKYLLPNLIGQECIDPL